MIAAAVDKPITVKQLAERYAEFAAEYYRKPSGRPTREAENVAAAMAHLVDVAGNAAIDTVSPATMRAVRARMIEAGLARTTINARVNRVRRVFKWAVAEQLVGAQVMVGLQCLEPLKRGRSAAVEPAGIRPVDEADVEATCAQLREPLPTMVRVQLLTGMRCGELLIMRPCDVDRSADAWTYRPREHKTEHFGQRRVIVLGPRARDLVRPWLDAGGENPWLFPTLAAERPLWTNRAGRPWNPGTYRQAIVRAAQRAVVPAWTPLQLRHTAATRLRKLCGLEAARAVLGHSKATTTEIYAELDQEKAIDAMQLLG